MKSVCGLLLLWTVYTSASFAGWEWERRGMECSRRGYHGIYTFEPSRRCDGWPRTSLSTCKQYCRENRLPPGCRPSKNAQCNYMIWDDNRGWWPGFCQLASSCQLQGKGSSVTAKIRRSVNECLRGNGGCQHICIDQQHGFRCACRHGYRLHGRYHCTDVNECANGNGGCSHTCVNTHGGHHCQCPHGFVLGKNKRTCADVNECASGNGGCSHTCVNTNGGHHCTCPNGFVLGKDKKTCADVNECANGNGGCSHICVNTNGGHHCICPNGFVLGKDKKTCADVNECANGNGGCSHTCVNTNGGHHCQCPNGFVLGKEKKTCADVNECANGNGGCSHTCVNTNGGHHCQCPKGFVLGKDKKTCADEDECKSHKSGCAQKCVNTVGGFHCLCNPGFTLSKDGKTCTDFSYKNYKDKDCSAKTVWHSQGCYDAKPSMVRGKLLIYWRHDIEWKKDRMKAFGKSMMCACAEAAREHGAQYFGTHFWGECYAVDMKDMVAGGGDCHLADGLYKTKCGKKTETFGCLGNKSYYVYKL